MENQPSIQDLILNFRNDINYQKLYDRYRQKSFSEILSIHRWERSHSSFLAWVFDDNQPHGIGTFSIERILEIVMRRDSSKILNDNIKKAIVSGSYKIESVKVELEKTIESKKYNKKGYIDIYLHFTVIINEKKYPISIIIENKVDSSENEDEIQKDGEKSKIFQTQRYFEYFEENEESINKIYLYLTPIGNIELEDLKEPLCACKEFIQINYQNIVDHILEPILKIENVSSRTKLLIQEYLHSLSQPSLEYIVDEKDNEIKKQKKTKTLIMAMQQEESDLLMSVWKNNEDFFTKMFEAIKSDDSVPKEIREQTEKMSNAIRDSKQYKYQGKIYGVGRLALAVIKDFVKDSKIKNIKELMNSLDENWFADKNKAEKTKKTKRKRHFLNEEELITLEEDNSIIAVTTEWTQDNIGPLIKKAEKLGFIIERIN